jgi:ABC-type Mn2+/Zn2+ transport system ATPase subunit
VTALVAAAPGVAPPAGERPLAEAADLAAGYGGPPAITGVTFAVDPGVRIGVLGPNGGGKTTLFRALLGELRPSAGQLRVRVRCGSVPQTERSRLDYPVSALDVALMGALSRLPWWRPPGRAQRRQAMDALERVQLAEQARRPFGELSGGQRQRVLIARALVQDARLLLLDEPFSGLDMPSAEGLMGLLAELAADGRSVLVSSHDIEQARSWDLVLCLNQRQVAFGPPSSTLTLAVVEATYGGSLVELPRGDEIVRGLAPPHHHPER